MRPKGRFFIFLAAALLLLPLLAACEDTELVDELVDMAKEWAQEKGLVDEELNVDWINVGAYYAQKAAQGSTGDSTLDAALTAGPTVRNFHQADSLAAQGLEEGNLDLIDQALALRPEDWSYYDKKAAVLTQQGRVEEAQQSFGEAEWLVDERIQNGGDCKALRLNLYRNREQALLAQLAADPENAALLDMLDETQGTLYYLENDHEKSPCR